jgi:AcrR family transcriptional regulator
MARHKEFEREEVLDRAIEAFAQHGFAGTSTENVLQAMGISRQSMYDTFGDKRQLFLEALARYNDRSTGEILQSLHSATSPLAGVQAALVDFAARHSADDATACLGVGSICEFGASDPGVVEVNSAAGARLTAALEKAITAGKQAGEIASDVKVRAAAQFILATFTGLRVAARSGTPSPLLRDLAQLAARSLRS